MRALGRAALITLVLGAAAYAAYLLWPTSVPDDLAPPNLDVHDEFDADVLAEAESFDAFGRWTFLLSQVVVLGVLIAYARRGARLMRQSAAGPIGTGFLLGMLGLGLAWLVTLPFEAAGYWWGYDNNQINVSFLEWALGEWAGLAGTFLRTCAALLVAMGFAKLTKGWWWVPAAGVFTGVILLLAFLTPYLVGGHPPRSAALRADAARISEQAGASGVPLRIEEVSDLTSSPNAFAAGLGPSRRVYLWDTLAGYPRREVQVTLAHEYAHIAKRHIIQSIAWFGLIALAAGLIVMLLTRRRGGMADPRAVPLALLVVFVLQLVASPLESAVSRRNEAEADWAALNTTRNPGAMVALFRDFAKHGKGDPDPPGWFHVLFEGHPSGLERIEMARAWAARH
jgi:STE24 endopeptidase